jgi:hypothetical protein
MADPALLAEAYKRGLLPADKASAYEEGVRRGLVTDNYALGRLKARAKPASRGATATFDEAVPLLDEAKAGMLALADTLSGKGSLDKTWKANRDFQEGEQAEFKTAHPIAANAMTGMGYSVQAIPMFFSGGASAAPAIAEKAPSMTGRLAAGAKTVGKNAAIGASYAAANAAAGRGSASDRLKAASSAVIPGAAAGVVVPMAGDAAVAGARLTGKLAGATGRTAVRMVNAAAAKTGAGPFLDPHSQAVGRLAEAMRADGFSSSQIASAVDEWQRVGGASPAFMDVLAKNGGGQRTMALIRGAAMSGGGRNVASKYGARVAADLQDVAIERTRALAPGGRTIPDVTADVERRIATHSAAPEVEPGSGGVQVSAALNTSYDRAKAGVDAAYARAREAAPEAAHLAAADRPALAASLRESVRDFHPQDIPSVTRVLGDVDRLSTPTLRDLFEARQHLSSLRATPDIQGAAASRAVRALDSEIEAAVERGAITGDPQVVNLWRTAIGARRDFGRQFEGDDLIAQLTERGRHGSGRANVVAPEDASSAILGRNGLAQRPDLVRDLTRLRDTLGADSPQWEALRQEALSRVLGRDSGTENYGAAFGRFNREAPQLARILVSPADLASVRSARGNIASAVADRRALETGRGVMTTPTDQFRPSMTAIQDRRELAQTGAAGELVGMIERPPEGATGVLNRIGTATRARNNLSETFGQDAAADYQAAIRNSVEQVQNARFINPNSGSQTAGRLADEELVASIPTSKLGLIATIVGKMRAGVSLTDQERQILVEIATSPANFGLSRVEEALAPPPAPRMVGQPSVRATIAGPMTQDRKR